VRGPEVIQKPPSRCRAGPWIGMAGAGVVGRGGDIPHRQESSKALTERNGGDAGWVICRTKAAAGKVGRRLTEGTHQRGLGR
jgi:hypothetical protein